MAHTISYVTKSRAQDSACPVHFFFCRFGSAAQSQDELSILDLFLYSEELHHGNSMSSATLQQIFVSSADLYSAFTGTVYVYLWRLFRCSADTSLICNLDWLHFGYSLGFKAIFSVFSSNAAKGRYSWPTTLEAITGRACWLDEPAHRVGCLLFLRGTVLYFAPHKSICNSYHLRMQPLAQSPLGISLSVDIDWLC